MTERMSYLEIACPVGLLLMGIFALILGDGFYLRKVKERNFSYKMGEKE